MTTLDIARLSPQERLDLIGALCDSLLAEDVALTPAQEAELARRLAPLEYVHEALDWAKPYIDEAFAEAERGEVVNLDEHNARMDALLSKLSPT